MVAATTSRGPLGGGSLRRRQRGLIRAVLAVLVAAALIHYLLPHIVSLGPTLRRLRHGYVAWLAVGVALVAVAGFGLWFGLFSGPAPVGLTLVPVDVATALILIVLSMLFVNQPATEFLERRAERSRGRASKWWHHAAAAPHSVHAGLLSAPKPE